MNQPTWAFRVLEAEREYSQALVAEMAHSRQEESRAKRALESAVEENSALDELSASYMTTAVMISLNLDPRK